ncbi:MHYT domain-containing protein [Rhodococcus sp. NPDC058521]|uniref:MHYT domain-containing protein n=1 Tax=Rhodococcus sp. NPDC058521 TaxID=3346536 RepID=UPI0036504042
MTDHLDQFSMGSWILALAVATSFAGLFVGVASARKSVTVHGSRHRASWLAWGALSIGGIGLWLPQIIGMVGLAIEGSPIRYDLVWVGVSIVVAIASGFAALFAVSPAQNRHRTPPRSIELGRLLVGAAILTVGATAMNLAIVSGVQIQGDVEFDIAMIAASAVVSLFAAALVLWTVQAVDARPLRLITAVVAAGALVASHYIAVYALEVSVDPASAQPQGVEVFSILFPVFVVGLLVLTIPITALLMAPDRVAAELDLEADTLAAESADREFERR